MFCIYCGKQLSEGETCTCKTPQSEATDAQPVLEQPAPDTSVYEQPVQPFYNQMPYNQPVQQAYNQPIYGQPVQPFYNQPMQPTYSQPVYTQPAYSMPVQPSAKSFEPDEYTETILSVIKAPATVFFALLFTLAFAVKLIGALDFDIPLLIGMIGAWTVNSQIHTYGAKPKSSGYKILSVAELINIILHCIISVGTFVILIILITSNALNTLATDLFRFFNGNIAGYRVGLTPLAVISLCVLTLSICGFILYYHIALRKNLLYIRKRLAQKPIHESFTILPNIIMVLHGVLEIALCVLIFMTKSLIIHYINKSLSGNQELTMSILTIGINFGIPVALFLTGTARILAGSVLCKLSCKLKKIAK